MKYALLVGTLALFSTTVSASHQPRIDVAGNILLLEYDDPVDLRLVRRPVADAVQPTGYYGVGVYTGTIGGADFNKLSQSVRAYYAALQFATGGDGQTGYWILASTSGRANPRWGPDGLIPRVVGFPDGHIEFNYGDAESGLAAPPHKMRALELNGVNLEARIATLEARIAALER